MTFVAPESGVSLGPFMFPASSAQRRIWFFEQAQPGTPTYNIARALLVRGPLDVAALRAALERLAARHDSLRTRFAVVNGQPLQIVGPLQAPALTVDDGSDDAEAAGVQEWLFAQAQATFDLARGPLFRGALRRLAADRHALCLVAHHSVVDGWSLGVIERELGQLYRAICAGRDVDLPEPAIQYGDYAVWEEERLRDGDWERQLDYWRRIFATPLPLLNVGADFPRPIQPTGRGGRIWAEASPDLMAAVRQQANDASATPFMVLLAAFGGFVSRVSGQADVAVGTPLSGRDRLELEHVVGMFVNTAAIRLRVDGAAGFRSLVDATRLAVLDGLQHQDIPFDRVVRAVQPLRIPGVPPLFQVMFTLQSDTGVQRSLGSLQVSELFVETRTAKCDLTLAGVEEGGRLTLRLEYNADLFTRQTAERLLQHFQIFARNALARSERALSRIALVDEASATEARRAGTGERRDYGREPIHVRVRHHAAAQPSAVAIEDGERRVTYRQLVGRAAALAGRLHAAGAGRGSRVGICLERGADLVIAMLAVLETGAVYVPIEATQPRRRIASILDDAGIEIVIASAATRALLAGSHRHAIDVNGSDSADLEQAWRPPDVMPDDPAYVMYTSGSTGVPKGVVVPHRAIARLVVNADYISISASDRVAQASNAAFDAATFEIWGALLNAATVVCVTTDDLSSPRRLGLAITRDRLTVLFLTTAVFNRVADECPSALTPLRVLLFGGEAVDPQAVRRVVADGAPGTLLHVYGPTESTTFATAFAIADVRADASTVPIGRPIANTDAHVLDEGLQPVPEGVPGELYLGGDGLALGYLGLPALTAERFVNNPWATGTLYRTGDRCVRRAGGVLEFVGRLDRQIKLRGFRIEPGEIEAALLAHPDIVAALVTEAGDTAAERALAAFVVPRAGRMVDAPALRDFLRQRVPPYMVPASVTIAHALPLTVNGKVDSVALMSSATCDERVRAVRQPRDPLEAELARIWEELLEVTPIGIADDFFDLGGHSLLAATMSDRAEDALGCPVPISMVLEHPTIAQLASAISARVATDCGIIKVRSHGSRPPLFFLHGDMNGAGVYTSKLARALDEDQPFFALPPLGIDIADAPASIEAMASAHLQVIRRERPQGPYLVGGYCEGALEAFEIARQLREGGDRATSVFLVQPSPVDRRLATLDRSVRAAAALTGMSDAQRIALFLRARTALAAWREAGARGRVALIGAKFRRVARPPEVPAAVHAASAAAPRHDPRVWSHYLRAVAAYVPRRYPGRITVLVGDDVSGDDGDGARGWRTAASEVTVRRIRGDHRTCVTVHAGGVANELREWLRDREAEWQAP